MPMLQVARISALFLKDIKSELRTRYAVSSILLFVLTAVSIIVFSLAQEKISHFLYAGILWILMFFSAMTGLAKAFVSEEERGTSMLLAINTNSTTVFFGKLIFNIMMSLVLNLFALALFLLFIMQDTIHHPLILVFSVITGSIGIASASTIISAIIAKANTKNALFPVLSFPVLIPLIIIGIETTQSSFQLNSNINILANFQLMLGYTGAIIITSYLLFDFVWKE